MIVATQKCGCPPPSKDTNATCSPCCSSGKKVSKKRPKNGDCPASSCCKKRAPKSVSLCPPQIDQPPACCPMMPPVDTKFERPQKLRSDIAERGLPYKEIEAIINNNKVVIRTQKETIEEVFEPPCDCKEDARPGRQKVAKEIDHSQPSGNRTVTVYPTPKQLNPEAEEENTAIVEQAAQEVEPEICKNVEENPNIFLLRVKNRSVHGDRRFNIDLEFKTPRPWSHRKRKEIESIGKSAKMTIDETIPAKEPKEEEKQEVPARPFTTPLRRKKKT